MRAIMTIAALAAMALSKPAWAQDKCNQLQIVNTIQMLRGQDGRDFVPVVVNGTQRTFLFDTGGFISQIAQRVVDELKLPTRQSRMRLFNMTGQLTDQSATVQDFTAGFVHDSDVRLQVAPFPAPIDGIFALDHWTGFDLDVNFATDKLNMFSQDHCPGRVQYWTAPALAVLPVTLKRDRHIWVQVMLDGHEEQAIIDSGASRTSLTIAEAERVFHLGMGASDTPEAGYLNGDTSLKTYQHLFKTLAFGGVTVDNPELDLIPNAMGRDADRAQLVGDRTKTEKDLLDVPDVTIGMDVLRKLHIYMALKEEKLYITEASASALPAPVSPAGNP